MASPGTPAMFETVVPYARQDVYQRLLVAVSGQAGNYFDGTTVMGDGQSVININRKFVPTWAIVLCFLCVGLLMLLFRSDENAMIQVQDVQGGTSVRMSGTVSPSVYQSINMTLSGMQAAR